MQLTADPENEGTQNLQRHTVGLEGDGCLQWVTIFVIEASLTGSEHNRRNESGDTTRHVHDTGSGKVDDTDIAEQAFVVKSGKETIRAPHRVHDDGIYKAGQEDRVAQVSRHLASFGNRTGDDRGGSGRERKLEEETNPGIEFTETKVAVTNKGAANAVGSTVGKTVSDRVETNGSTTGIQEVLEHDILDILGSHGTSAKHGETGLHKEHEGSLLW